MSDTPPPVIFQIISGEHTILSLEDQIPRNKNICKVVAVFGPQNGGKTTLINAATGSTMPVLSTIEGGSTTLGVHGVLMEQDNLMVLDFEGTDGMGQQDDSVAIKMGIFALTACDSIVINLDFNDRARQSGGGFDLLKLIIEANVNTPAISTWNRRTGLIFALRNCPRHYLDNAALISLRSFMSQRVSNVWQAIEKPTQLNDAPVSRLFDVDVQLFPSCYDQPAFNLAASGFMERLRGDALQPSYSRGIPIDRLHKYFEDLWNDLQQNNRANITSVRKAISETQCRRLYHDLALGLSRRIPSLMASFDDGTGEPPDIIKLRNDMLGFYDRTTQPYDPEVALIYSKRLEDKFDRLLAEAAVLAAKARAEREEVTEKNMEKAGKAAYRGNRIVSGILKALQNPVGQAAIGLAIGSLAGAAGGLLESTLASEAITETSSAIQANLIEESDSTFALFLELFKLLPVEEESTEQLVEFTMTALS